LPDADREPDADAHAPATEGSQRLDKWLWQARFFKTRGLAAKLVADGKVRVNGTRVSKAARSVVPGDTLTFPQARAIRVVRIVALPVRRGPATEAQRCYEDLSPAPPPRDPAAPVPGGPRPTKKDRRNMPGF
jgi:ribosome-associated heat shock protein Hsp15